MRVASALLVLTAGLGFPPSVPRTGQTSPMAEAARVFSASLDDAGRSRASFALDDAARKDWHFVPRERPGLRVGDLGAVQAKSFQTLLDATLSAEGLDKVDGVLRLEGVLREQEGDWRDPGAYAITLFGEPGGSEPWGWRFEGHHLSLNLCAAGDRVAVTPLFFGANPAEVGGGPSKGLRVLGAEEDLACDLAKSLDERQRAKGLREADVPADVLLGPERAASLLEPAGIAASDLDAEQRERLAKLVARYAGSFEAGLSGAALDRLRATRVEDLHFLWIGATERGKPHYWRVQGKGFVIELDDVQGGANHVHTLWRDLADDHGEDLLRRHREEHHRGKSQPR